MRRNSGSGFAILLIACGALILLSRLGLGNVAGFVVAAAMVALGLYSVKNGSRFMGWVILIIGGLVLLSKLSWIIGLVLAIGLIGYGVSILKKNRPMV